MLACAYEFLPEGPEKKPEPKVVPAIAKAYGLMGYDAGALLPAEADFLKDTGAAAPPRFTVLGTAPKTEIIQAGGQSLGIVFFPPAPNPKEAVPPALGDQVVRAAQALRGKAGLVVGISSWGMVDEEAFVNAHSGALDILLGSGPGSGTAGRASKDGKTLWSRAYIKGKTINRLDLLALPGGTNFTWKAGGNFKAEVVSLDEHYPADPEIQKLF